MKDMIKLAINIAIDTEFFAININDTHICEMRNQFIDMYRKSNIVGDITIESEEDAPNGMILRVVIKPNGIIHSCGMFYA